MNNKTIGSIHWSFWVFGAVMLIWNVLGTPTAERSRYCCFRLERLHNNTLLNQNFYAKGVL